jgi:transcriptional regulator with XRE-family HTH domain
VTDERHENLAQLIAQLKAEYQVSEPQIADAIGVSVSAVNYWASGKRGGTRGPRRRSLEALAEAYPKFTRERIFAAASRRAPGPLDPSAEARILDIFRELTDEQRELMETQWRPVAEKNRAGQ